MRQLSASHGSVLLHLDNGKTCDLKKDATARSVLQMNGDKLVLAGFGAGLTWGAVLLEW